MNKQINRSKLKKMLTHSLASFWLRIRIPLVMLFLLSLFLYLVAILFIDALKTQDYLIALCCSFLLGMIFMKCIDAIIFITRIGIERFAWFIENKNLIYHLPQNND